MCSVNMMDGCIFGNMSHDFLLHYIMTMYFFLETILSYFLENITLSCLRHTLPNKDDVNRNNNLFSLPPPQDCLFSSVFNHGDSGWPIRGRVKFGLHQLYRKHRLRLQPPEWSCNLWATRTVSSARPQLASYSWEEEWWDSITHVLEIKLEHFEECSISWQNLSW